MFTICGVSLIFLYEIVRTIFFINVSIHIVHYVILNQNPREDDSSQIKNSIMLFQILLGKIAHRIYPESCTVSFIHPTF